ncbi:MAG: NAD(P)-dependent oxidoreductase [Chthoniobacterales bacterium]
MIYLFVYLAYSIGYSVVMGIRGFRSPAETQSAPASSNIKRVLIIGATGGTGRELVSQALEQGYEVTALVRDPAKLQIDNPRLHLVRGDVLNPESLDGAVRGQDAVLSALGHRRLYVPSRVQSEGTRNVLRAMEANGVRRFVVETSIGLGNSAGKLGLFATFLFLPVVLPIYFWDKARQEKIIAESSVDWVMVRPGVLTDGARRGGYRHGVDVGSYIATGKIGRADVADFMLQQLTSNVYLRCAPAIVW